MNVNVRSLARSLVRLLSVCLLIHYTDMYWRSEYVYEHVRSKSYMLYWGPVCCLFHDVTGSRFVSLLFIQSFFFINFVVFFLSFRISEWLCLCCTIGGFVARLLVAPFVRWLRWFQAHTERETHTHTQPLAIVHHTQTHVLLLLGLHTAPSSYVNKNIPQNTFNSSFECW